MTQALKSWGQSRATAAPASAGSRPIRRGPAQPQSRTVRHKALHSFSSVLSLSQKVEPPKPKSLVAAPLVAKIKHQPLSRQQSDNLEPTAWPRARSAAAISRQPNLNQEAQRKVIGANHPNHPEPLPNPLQLAALRYRSCGGERQFRKSVAVWRRCKI